MGNRKEVHRANRRFEFAVYLALPEHPRPMYERDTYGRVGDSLSHAASGPYVVEDVDVYAQVVVRDGRVIFEKAK